MNFFKNAIIYRIGNPMSLMAQLATIEQQLLPFQFTPCGSNDMAKTGWIPATAFSQTLAHQANGQYLLTVQRQEKNPARSGYQTGTERAYCETGK